MRSYCGEVFNQLESKEGGWARDGVVYIHFWNLTESCGTEPVGRYPGEKWLRMTKARRGRSLGRWEGDGPHQEVEEPDRDGSGPSRATE